MTRLPFARPSMLIGAVAVAASLLVAACGTGPIPGQSSTQTSTSTSSSSSSSSSSSGCTAANAQTAVTVDATNALRFVPASVCLKVGGTITWKNVGNIFHTTTDEKALAANPANAELPTGATGWNHPLNPGTSFSLKFTVAGTYKYFCIPHETLGMLGQITVVS
jgi:plastocyanin